jgi:site-specific DNA recombinase
MKPAILYAAKSTLDKRGSIATQLDDGRRLSERESWDVVAEYQDEAASAWSGDRGPGLQAALEHAERIAPAVLVVQHTDRLARGDGVKARHLGEIYFWALKADVEIRSAEDDSTFTNPLLAFAMGERNAADSLRKSQTVKAGKRRARQRGRPHGGQRGYGFNFAGHGQGLVLVPAEIVVVRRIFSEFVGGKPRLVIARDLVQEGIKTANGGLWRHNSVTRILSNPLYIGKIQVDGEVFDGEHEPVIDLETWKRAQALLASRSTRQRGRRPKGRHLFTKGLLRCSCGEAMVPRTTTGKYMYESYFCNGRQQLGPSFCDALSIRRELVDTAVYNYFEQVALDVEATRQLLTEATDRKLAEIRTLLRDAEREANLAAERFTRVERDYMDGRIDAADWQRFRDRLTSEAKAAASQAASLATSEADIARHAAAVDAEHEALRQLAAVRQAIAGDIREADGVDAVRAALTRLFDAFVIHRSIPELVHVELVGDSSYWIEPIVKADAIEGQSPSGRPVLHLERLDLAGRTIDTTSGLASTPSASAARRSSRRAPTCSRPPAPRRSMRSAAVARRCRSTRTVRRSRCSLTTAPPSTTRSSPATRPASPAS